MKLNPIHIRMRTPLCLEGTGLQYFIDLVIRIILYYESPDSGPGSFLTSEIGSFVNLRVSERFNRS